MIPVDSRGYHRPFTDDFADCAHDPAKVEAKNMYHVPIPPIWSCRHLAVGQYPGRRGRLYARCALGDLAARRQAVLERLRRRRPDWETGYDTSRNGGTSQPIR